MAVDVNRDDAERAAAEYLRRPGGWNLWPADAERIARDAVDAAAPHLTADLERERDEALAEVERLRGSAAVIDGDRNLWRARAERAEAAIARVEALADEWVGLFHLIYKADAVRHIRAALRGDTQ